jgi:hypothetical protein
LRIACRSGNEGHLIEFVTRGPRLDLTSGSHDRNRQPAPPATYRPAAYVRPGEAPRIVFRALRGHIWQIKRDTLSAEDLTAASSAPTAAGGPAVVVAGGAARIAYRGVDGALHEIFDDAGTWRTRQIRPASTAAADPAMCLDAAGDPVATFRAMAGEVGATRWIRGAWTREDIGVASPIEHLPRVKPIRPGATHAAHSEL